MLTISHKYEVGNLFQRLVKVVPTILNVGSVCHFLRLGHLYKITDLVNQCHKWIFQADGWHDVTRPCSFCGWRGEHANLPARVKKELKQHYNDCHLKKRHKTQRLVRMEPGRYDQVRASQAFKDLPDECILGITDFAAHCGGVRDKKIGSSISFESVSTSSCSDNRS